MGEGGQLGVRDTCTSCVSSCLEQRVRAGVAIGAVYALLMALAAAATCTDNGEQPNGVRRPARARDVPHPAHDGEAAGAGGAGLATGHVRLFVKHAHHRVQGHDQRKCENYSCILYLVRGIGNVANVQ